MSDTGTKLSDAEIIARFKDGDVAIFQKLVDRYAGRAYQIAYGVLGSREDAEEVAQDVFVRIFRSLGRFRGDSEFTTWMYRIAMNLARNKYRWNKSRGARREISLQETLSDDETRALIQLAEERPSPDLANELNEFETNVMKEIDNLPPLYREALVMRNIDEMSYEQIAHALGCKLGTIKSRIARAREELRKRLGV
ncbi:MAG: ECF RNA polymerase sigma factor SigW [Lentisphaerae bacterium ADurb.BinA184]|nr:MAG: ECF RNA polymerase sigma factor SigW [Lentisphaerae bacterium ADurb.BinA184]